MSLCSICLADTYHSCGDCRVDLGTSVFVCERCIRSHELRCPARLMERVVALTSALQDLADWVYCPACEWARIHLKRDAPITLDPPTHTCKSAFNVWSLKPRVDAVLKDS